jgi:hypothetical protein
MKLPVESFSSMGRSVLVDRAAGERIGRKFADWLASTVKESSKKWWLVLDGLAEAKEIREDLVDHLLLRLQNEPSLTQVILILLGYEGGWHTLLRPYVLGEELEALTRTDVERFVDEYAQFLQRVLRPEEKQDIVQSIAKDWPGPFSPAQMVDLYDNAAAVVEGILV